MGVARRGRQVKRRGRKDHAAVIPKGPRRWLEAVLFPAALPELESLVREVHDYMEAMRSADWSLLPRLVQHGRTVAKGAKAAVPRLFDDLHSLSAWTRLTDLIPFEPETAMDFRADAARFETKWRPYLIRLQEAAGRVMRHRMRRGSRRNVLREVVVARLTGIIATHRRDPRHKLFVQGRDREHPGGLVCEVLGALALPCFPRSAAGLYKAVERARARQR
jgi:hypothetical protein